MLLLSGVMHFLPEPAGGCGAILCGSVFLLCWPSFWRSGQEMTVEFCSLTAFSDWICLTCLRFFSLVAGQQRSNKVTRLTPEEWRDTATLKASRQEPSHGPSAMSHLQKKHLWNFLYLPPGENSKPSWKKRNLSRRRMLCSSPQLHWKRVWSSNTQAAKFRK